MNKETRNRIGRIAAIYLGWLLMDFFFRQALGNINLESYQLKDVLPVTICFGWILFHNLILFKNLVLVRKKYWIYAISFASSLYFFSVLYNWAIPAGEFKRTVTYMIAYNFFLAVVGTTFFLSWNYFVEKRNSLLLTALNREAELKQLKSQLNPHFLFNSLNNIYSYNLENNKHGNDLILKLSELMRFMVETSNRNTVFLSEELGFIGNYINFETERLGHRCEIVFEKKVNRMDCQIPPLMLFPFIENAFKHGTSSLGKSKVEIAIESDETSLQLVVKNSVRRNGAISTHTGLANIRKRLELQFPGTHRLDIEKDEENFKVMLKIPVS